MMRFSSIRFLSGAARPAGGASSASERVEHRQGLRHREALLVERPPTITPVTPSGSSSLRARRSSRLVTPPEAMISSAAALRPARG